MVTREKGQPNVYIAGALLFFNGVGGIRYTGKPIIYINQNYTFHL